jgi:predicted ester cyclase
MTEAQEVAQRYDDAFNAHDLEARMAALTADSELVMPGGIDLRGQEQIGELVKVFWEAMPDAELTREHQATDGSTVVTEGRLMGTHTGPFRSPQGDLPPTGNRVEFRYASVRRIEGGKIRSEHLYFDQLEFLPQIGAMPQPPGPQ